MISGTDICDKRYLFSELVSGYYKKNNNKENLAVLHYVVVFGVSLYITACDADS